MTVPPLGLEWVVDAQGCAPSRLREPERLLELVSSMLADLRLSPVAPPLVHRFPGEGGVTAMVLLAESHLTLHTFPEHGTMTLNLYSCVARPPYPFRERIERELGATRVDVRSFARGALP